MKAYLDLLAKIMDHGTTVQTGAFLPGENRQPTAKRLHDEKLKFNLADGFPAVTTKPLWWRAVVAEWIWFTRGTGDATYLVEQKADSIWRSWFKEGSNDLGPVYGRQFRRFQGVQWPQSLPDVATLYRDGDRLFKTDDTGATVYYKGGVYRIEGDKNEIVTCVHGPVVEVDQIASARDDIRAVVADAFNRARRRIIVTLWNPAQIKAMALPPCHTIHFYDMAPPEFPEGSRITAVDARQTLDLHRAAGGPMASLAEYAAEQPAAPHVTYAFANGSTIKAYDTRWTLNLHLVARSIDAVKGLPFNIASYALMLEVMARITGCKPGTLTITFNDVHIYDNQFADVREQLDRVPYPLPRLVIDDAFDEVCKDLTIEEAHRLETALFRLEGYQHHPKLKSESEVAV